MLCMISKVRLRNWKSHLDSEFRFNSGVNALVGINGAGKSSVLDSVCFALFGTFPMHNSRKVSLDDLIMNKPQKKEEAEISLEFRVGESIYSIRRVISRGKGTTHAEIRENGNLLDINASNVNSYIERVLKVDYPLFSRAIYSEQNNIDYFLTIPKGKRMQHIDEMLRLDRFERVREYANRIMNSFSERAKEKIKVAKDMEEGGIEKRLEAAQKELDSVLEAEKKCIKELEEAKSRKKEASERLHEMEEKYIEFVKAEKVLQGIDKSIEEISNILSLKKELIEIHSMDNLERDREKIIKSLKDFEELLKQKEKEQEEMKERIASLNTEIRLTTKESRSILELENKCPVCESEITMEKKKSLISRRSEKETGLRDSVTGLVKNLETMTDEIYDIKSSIKEFEKKSYALKSLLDELDVIADLKTRLKENTEKKEELAKKVSELASVVDEKAIASMRESLTMLKIRESELVTKLAGMEEIEVKNRQIANDLKERVVLLSKYREEISKTGKSIENIGKFVSCIKAAQDGLRQEFLSNVNSIMSKVWKDLYSYGDMEEIRLFSEDDYVLKARAGNEWVSVDTLSGGERNLSCLALRIAFSLAFTPNLRWLILDEPTHNLDRNAINNFSHILRDKINDLVSQVFLITHEESIADVIDTSGSVYRLERDKANNGATRIAL